MNNSQKVLSQRGLQYFYNQISNQFASTSDVNALSIDFANHKDSMERLVYSMVGEIEGLYNSVGSLTQWKLDSFGTTQAGGTTKPYFKGMAQHVLVKNTPQAGFQFVVHNQDTDQLHGLSGITYYQDSSYLGFKIGDASHLGIIELCGANGKGPRIFPNLGGNSFISFPAGGSATSPAMLALSSEVSAVDSRVDTTNNTVSSLQSTVSGHTTSISNLTTTVNAIPNTYATKANLTTEINKVLNGVDANLLDGLNEVIAALNSDKNFYTTMTALINEKASKAELNSTVTSAVDTINDALAGKASTSVVTATANGIVPKANEAKGTISSSTADWVFTNKNGTIGWYKLPANAFNDTTYTLPAAGSSLGGVKTGGNVTISNGVITVNNDGHTHTVANVTNLSNLLDEKITASAVTFTTSGSGNAITDVSFNATSKVFTLTKGATYNNYSLPVAKYNTLGGVKPAYTSTAAATLTTAAASNSTAITIATRSTSSSNYYGVEADKNGVLFVNVPWANNSVKQSPSATNGAFPVLLRGTSAGTTETTAGTSFVSSITANPSTGTITATKFVGDGSGLTTLSAANISAGTLAVARGGTGVTSNPSMLINLGSTTAASVFAASPRPGVTGTLAVTNGGTGATNAKAALTNLGVYYGSTAPSSPQE